MEFPYELGWVFVRPEAREQGLAKDLVAACLESAGTAIGVFATTQEDNDRMRCCLAKKGFKREGQPYESTLGEHLLVVYIRVAPGA